MRPALLIALLVTSSCASAQVLGEVDALRLLGAGQPRAALTLAEGLKPTVSVLEARALAHLELAARTIGPLRCSHAQAAYENAAMASSSALVERAQKLKQDERCPP